MAELLVNDFGSTLTAEIPIGAGPGGQFSLQDALPAGAVGRRVRCRLDAEILVADVASQTVLTIVQREAEDADRFPAATWPVGSQVDVGIVTADGFTARLADVADRHYTHDQQVPASTWTITHNLGKKPSIQVVDSSGRVVTGLITHLTVNSATVSFMAAGVPVGFSGKAFCN